MKFDTIEEVREALYGALSFLKNVPSGKYDRESNLIEEAMHGISARQDAEDWENERRMDMSREAETEAQYADEPLEYPDEETRPDGEGRVCRDPMCKDGHYCCSNCPDF